MSKLTVVQCFCGNAPASASTKVQEAFCSFTCPGHASQTCGAGDHLTTYARTGTVPAGPANPATYGSLGCYTEATSGRALTGPLYTDDSLTTEKCAAKCAGFKYFGLEYRRECFCGNEPLGTGSVKVSQLECPYNCPGYRTQSCGGDNRLNLYEFGAAPVPETPLETAYSRDGCYSEAYLSPLAQGQRTLTSKQYFDDAMTVEKCATTCAGYTYFGLEYGRECFCGKSFTAGTANAAESDCSFACSGDGTQKCGAGDRLDIYKFGSRPPISSSTTALVSTVSYIRN